MDELVELLDDYSYLHSSRAALLAKLGRCDDAVAAYDRAIELTDNEAERRWMTQRRDAQPSRRGEPDPAPSTAPPRE